MKQKISSVLDLVYSKELRAQIHASNILIVGVGGIGCELLKVLTNSGYRKMTILDLDLIELTNLNRQFYFRRRHVGMSKAEVGKESVLQKDPTLDILAIHGSIYETRFDTGFYRQFDVVFCALDNVEAREHLGKMCIRSNRVMIDAGTSGFNGQVNAQIRNLTICNNCKPSPPPTTFAVCTIRATPSEPIHCVVYAMSLYDLLFGQPDKTNPLFGLLNLSDFQTDYEEILLQQNAIKIFNTIFHDQIAQNIEVKENREVNTVNKYKYPIKIEEALQIKDIYALADQNINLDRKSDLQRLKPVQYYAQLFIDAVIQIRKSDGVGNLKFEKDDQNCISFVTAATFFRTYNFTHKFKTQNQQFVSKDKFKYLTEYDVKVMGGKVIPAISSTNAIAAAVQCSECNKYLNNDIQNLKFVWITQSLKRLEPTNFPEPIESCQACAQNIIYIYMSANLNETKFKEFLTIIQKFNITDRPISISGSGYTIYDKSDSTMEDCNIENLDLAISEFYDHQINIASFTIFEENGNQYWNYGIRYDFMIQNSNGPLKYESDSSVDLILAQRQTFIINKVNKVRQIRNRLYEKIDHW